MTITVWAHIAHPTRKKLEETMLIPVKVPQLSPEGTPERHARGVACETGDAVKRDQCDIETDRWCSETPGAALGRWRAG